MSIQQIIKDAIADGLKPSDALAVTLAALNELPAVERNAATDAVRARLAALDIKTAAARSVA